MRKLLTAFVTAAIVIAGSGMIWKAEAATVSNVGSLAPLTKSYTPVEKVYWRRHYRGYYGYGYRPYGYYGYGYRPYGYYGYGWRPGFSISIGPRWGWGY
jgi:hypothetical protein